MLSWMKEETPEELHGLLTELGQEYEISSDSQEGLRLHFKPVKAPAGGETTVKGPDAFIRYSSKTQAARALGNLLAGLADDGKTLAEKRPFETIGMMLDCSRNAVMTADYFKKWLRRLALMGYNMAMLYTEETYELPGEPYFGYQRGRYTMEELQEIDRYADCLGIEMIPCIQTLGHMEQILRWHAYDDIKDVRNVMLVDEPKTYALVDKMLDFWSSAFKTRRIHIGLDETWGLGRGKFIDRFGYQPSHEILGRHVEKVVKACRKRGLEPMMWHDMYVRMFSKTENIYDANVEIPADVLSKIPEGLQLVYWDYYHEDEKTYKDMISLVRKMGREPIMAGGVWTWGHGFWHQHGKTEKFGRACINACRKEGVKEIFFTMWGDDGGFCEYDSSLAGLLFSADQAYAGQDNAEALEKRFRAICQASYSAVVAADELNNATVAMIWDDPIQGIFWRQMELKESDFWARTIKSYQNLQPRLARLAEEDQAVDFAFAHALCVAGLLKMQLRKNLEDAYKNRDNRLLEAVRRDVPGVADAMVRFMDAFRAQWMRRNKPQGLETMQRRLACVVERLRELDRRLEEYLDGRAAGIPELDEQVHESLENLPSWYQYISGGSTIQ